MTGRALPICMELSRTKDPFWYWNSLWTNSTSTSVLGLNSASKATEKLTPDCYIRGNSYRRSFRRSKSRRPPSSRTGATSTDLLHAPPSRISLQECSSSPLLPPSLSSHPAQNILAIPTLPLNFNLLPLPIILSRCSSRYLSRYLSHYLTRCSSPYLSRYLFHYSSRYLSRYLFHYLSRCSSRYLSRYLSHYLTRCSSPYLSRYLFHYSSRYLSRYLFHYSSRYLSRYLFHYLSRCSHNLCWLN